MSNTRHRCTGNGNTQHGKLGIEQKRGRDRSGRLPLYLQQRRDGVKRLAWNIYCCLELSVLLDIVL